MRCAVLGVCTDHELLAVAARLAGSLDDGSGSGGAEALSLPVGVDGEVAQLATVRPVFDSEHADRVPSAVTDEEWLPPATAGANEALRQDHEGNRLMVGDEGQLVVAHAHVECLSPVAGVDHFEHHIGHGASQSETGNCTPLGDDCLVADFESVERPICALPLHASGRAPYGSRDAVPSCGTTTYRWWRPGSRRSTSSGGGATHLRRCRSTTSTCPDSAVTSRRRCSSSSTPTSRSESSSATSCVTTRTGSAACRRRARCSTRRQGSTTTGRADLIGRGIGSAVISAFSEALFEAFPDVTDIVVTPQAANAASCRILEKAGYERRWTGLLDSDDPGDAGPAAMYVLARPGVDVG